MAGTLKTLAVGAAIGATLGGGGVGTAVFMNPQEAPMVQLADIPDTLLASGGDFRAIDGDSGDTVTFRLEVVDRDLQTIADHDSMDERGDNIVIYRTDTTYVFALRRVQPMGE